MNLKYQQGGVFTPPFVVYQPFMVPNQSESKTSKASKTANQDKELDLKDALALVKDIEGLEGDKSAVISSLDSLINNIINSTKDDGFMRNTSSIASEYLKIVNLIDNIKFQSNQYEKARDVAIANNTLGEPTIDSRGRVMVQSEEGFDWVTPREYLDNAENYNIVTNAELLEYRRLGVGGLQFDNRSLLTVAGSIGMKQITELITDAITSLGDKETNQYISGYVGVKAGELINGLESYIKALKNSDGKYTSIEDLYKINVLEKNQAYQAQKALEYIYLNLPEQAKSLLKLKSRKGTDEGAIELVQTLIASKQSDTITFEPELVGGDTREASGADSDDSKAKHSFISNVQAGWGADIQQFVLNNESANKMSVNVDVYENVEDRTSHEAIGKTSVDDMLARSGLTVNKNEAYFGNQKISPSKLQDMLYNGQAFGRIEVPVDSTGAPYFNLIEMYDEFSIELALGDKTAQQLLSMDKYKKLKPFLTPNGIKRKDSFKPFLVFDVATTEDLIGVSEDNKYVVDKESDPSIYNDIIYYLSKANPSQAEKYSNLDYKDFWGEFGVLPYDHVYAGTLYIELDMNKHRAFTSSGQSLPFEETRWEEEYQMSQKGGYNASSYTLPK